MPAAPANFVPILVVFVVGWRVLVRLRRNIGRQRLSPKRLKFRIALYAVVTICLVVFSASLASRVAILGGLLAGLLPGVALGIYGLSLTKFETTAEGRFYTPNPYMGIGLSMLMVGRLAYRYIVLYGAADRPAPAPQLMHSSLTLFIFGLLAGYYMAYFIGILSRSRDPQPASLSSTT